MTYTVIAVERAMKIQEVLLRAMNGEFGALIGAVEWRTIHLRVGGLGGRAVAGAFASHAGTNVQRSCQRNQLPPFDFAERTRDDRPAGREHVGPPRRPNHGAVEGDVRVP